MRADRSPSRLAPALAFGIAAVATPAGAETLTFADPAQDDFGPGAYSYPTDAVYKRGTFDLREVVLEDKGAKVEIRVTVSAPIEDPWDSKSWDGNGFSLQMVQVYLDTAPGGGRTETLPGLNAGFAKEDGWEKVVVISPQGRTRLEAELGAKAGTMKANVVIPQKTTARGKTLVAVVKAADLGGAPKATWGVQAVMQSNEGYPAEDDLLTRKVNEYPGQHRFGGGSDFECDPHVLDVLVAPAEGADGEKAAQKAALAYECGADGRAVRGAILPMVRKAK